MFLLYRLSRLKGINNSIKSKVFDIPNSSYLNKIQCSAVFPLWELYKLAFAPASKSLSITYLWPCEHAIIKGVISDWGDNTLKSAWYLLMSNSTRSDLPSWEAKCKGDQSLLLLLLLLIVKTEFINYLF